MNELRLGPRAAVLGLALLACAPSLRSQAPDIGPTRQVGIECSCNGRFTWYGSLPAGVTCRSLCVGSNAPAKTGATNAPSSETKGSAPAKGGSQGVVSKSLEKVSQAGPNLQDVANSVQSLVGTILADLERRDAEREAARKQEAARLAEQKRQQELQRQQQEAVRHQNLVSEMKTLDGTSGAASTKKTLPLGLKSLDETDLQTQKTALAQPAGTGAPAPSPALRDAAAGGARDPLDATMLDGVKELQAISNRKAELLKNIASGLDDKAMQDALQQLESLETAETARRENLQTLQEIQQRKKLDELLNSPQYARDWEEAKARVRQQEMAAFAKAEADLLDPAQLELYQRIKQGRSAADTPEAQAIFARLRKAQVTAMKQSTQELMTEAQRIRDRAALPRRQ